MNGDDNSLIDNDVVEHIFLEHEKAGAGKGKEVHLIIFTCVRYAREGIKDREEKKWKLQEKTEWKLQEKNKMEITEEKKDGGKIYYR